MEEIFYYSGIYVRHILSLRKTLCGYNGCLYTTYDRGIITCRLAALPLEPIADAIAWAGMDGQSELENTTGWHFNGAGFSNLLIK